jgi:hypothetical protein
VPYEVFKVEDVYITLGVANNPLWGRTCRALHREDLVKDPRFDTAANRVTNRRVLVPLLNEILGARPADEWLGRLDNAGVPAGRIKSVAEVCESAHLKARGMMVSLLHPKAGSITVRACRYGCATPRARPCWSRRSSASTPTRSSPLAAARTGEGRSATSRRRRVSPTAWLADAARAATVLAASVRSRASGQPRRLASGCAVISCEL